MCLTAFKAVMEMGRGEGEEHNNERKLIRRLPATDPDRWKALPEVPSRTEMGYLHLSFEYSKGALRVRVWQISDLLLPPPEISMIHSIFVRGYFLPDKVNKSHRRTEEIVVDVPDKNRVDTAATGIQHIFTPSFFKFQTPLMYTGLTSAIIRERDVQLEVCVTQRRTQQVFLLGMVHMPLRTALRRPIRQKYPLIPCQNHTTPNNMRCYSATLLHARGDHSATKGEQANGDDVRAAATGGEEELEDCVSLSGEDFLRSHLSLCLDEDSADEDGLARSGGSSNISALTSSRIANGVGSGGTSSSSSNTLNNTSGDEGGDDHNDDVAYDDEEPGDDDEVGSDWGDSRGGRCTPVDESVCDAGDISASKKKIIPNEVALDDSVVGDAVNGSVVNRSLESPGEAEIVPQSSSTPVSSPHADSNGFPDLDGSGPSAQNHALSSGTSAVQDTDNSTSQQARRKIIPTADLNIPRVSTDGDEESIRNGELSQDDPWQEGAGEAISTQKEDVLEGADKQNTAGTTLQSTTQPDSTTPPPAVQTAPSDSLAPPSDSLAPPSDSLASPSDSLAPPSDSQVPATGSPSLLSPLTDSGFSPASRPETPCWDFYDFSEDQLDLEGGAQCLEEGLAQLRQEGLGSLQNLSLEPVLPMVLVDDFDTLTADDE